MEFVRLFEPMKVNGITIPNRIVMPAMALFYAEDYAFNDRLRAFYRERARGGVGLIIMGPLAIDRVGSNPLMAGLFEDSQVEAIREFVKEVHEETEARVGVQLMHLGRYASSMATGMQPIAPTALASPLNNEVPREMDEDDIETVQDAFVKAALRASDAGCDFVELMAAGGYLIGEFLSPATNRRIDKYGGSSRNRMRFGLEIIEKVRQALGDGLALGIRVSGRDFITMGRTGAESARFCVEAERRGVNCINVTGGWHETNIPQITSDVPPGAYVHLARGVKERVKVPVFASNRLGDPEIAEGVLRSGAADAICWGRPLIADPDLPRKVKEGRAFERVPCIGCNQGCLDSILSNFAVSCTVNPRAGRESETRVEEAPVRKRVFVAGGGPAGLQFALTAQQRGHEVVLYEKAERLGGQVNLIAVVPGKEEFLGAVESLERRVRAAGADLRLRTELTCEAVCKEHPDLLVVATGARQTVLDIPGIDGSTVVNAWDVLNSSVPHIGRRIVIIGGGAMGCETALYLAHLAAPSAKTIAFFAFHEVDSLSSIKKLMHSNYRKITIIEIAKKAAASVGASTRWNLLKNLRLMGVELRLGVQVLRVEKHAVLIETSGGKESIPADTVVVATGTLPVNGLVGACGDTGIETITLGDAKEPRKIGDAIREGFDAALAV